MQFRPVLLGVCLILAFDVFSQQTNLINFVPVSPNAASLGKFGNVPVSYYTGIPSIEVPLYTIEQGGLKVPVKLAYHAGGIKVTELASWVGIGWGLHAGGSIMRNERGLSDDHSMGILNNGKTIDPSSLTINDYYKAAKGSLDLESDEYIFNFSGASGKFILDQQGKAYPIPYQHLQIFPLDYLGRPHTGGSILGWKIVTPDGIQYFFRAMETTRQPFEMTHNQHNTAWHLTSIVSADRADTIVFEYEDAGYSIPIPISQTTKTYAGTSFPCGGSGESVSRLDVMHSFGVKRIKRIVFNSGTIEFIPSIDDRCDLPGDEYLDKVVVKDAAGLVVKEFTMKYGYLYQSSLTPVEEFVCGGGNDANAVRLTLMSAQETGKTPYKFDYIRDIGLPTRYSTSQDHWGFFNRHNNYSSSLIPSGFETSPPPVRFMGTNREANINFAKQGTLYKVTYPTGGSTTIEYGAHKAKLTSIKNFPELSYGYTVTTNPARTFQVDYGVSGQVIGTFTIQYMESGTAVSFKAENFIESAGSYFKVVNSANEDMYVGLGAVDGPTRYYSTGTLPNGTYKIIAMKDGGGHSTGLSYSLTLGEYDNITYSQAQLITIGGLRVEKITDTDPLTNTEQVKEFEYTAGILTWGIKYASKVKEYLCYNLEGSMLLSYTIGDFYLISSSSNYPLSNTQGAPVGYGTVTVREFSKTMNGKIDNGYTNYEYTTAELYPDEGFASYSMQGHSTVFPPISGPSSLYSDNTSSSVYYQFPFSPPRNNDWKRGLLQRKTIYKRKTDGTYRAVSGEVNNYKIGSVPLSKMNVKCGLVFDSGIKMDEVNELRPLNAPMDEVAYSYYDANGEYLYLEYTENWNIDDSDHRLVTKTEYYYDNVNHLLPTRIATTNSSGDREVALTTYPKDYAAGTSFIDKLVSNNNLTSPIETVVYTQEAGNNVKIKEGYIFTYSDNGLGQKETIKALENTENLVLTNFNFSNASTGVIPTSDVAKTTFNPNSLYVNRLLFSKYKNGRLLQQQKSNDIVDSYIWGYNDSYPIAHAIGASNNSIAYTSFEEEGLGNWTVTGGTIGAGISMTGSKSLSISTGYTISKGDLPAGNYTVSYWSRNGSLLVNGTSGIASIIRNGWTHFEHELSSITAISVHSSTSNVIDELRLFPQGAQMQTFCYKLLVGVSHVTDTNNYILRYEYDANGRLQTVKDADGKIVQNFKYHYKGQ